MLIQDALKSLYSYEQSPDDWCMTDELSSTLIDVLIKAIPSRPNVVYGKTKGVAMYHCPTCDTFISTGVRCQYDYCSTCGQAIDWSGISVEKI